MRDLSGIRLRSGRHVSLSEITQTRTYTGMLEGVPTTQSNRQLLERLVEKHRGPANRAVYLVPPKETLTPLPDNAADPEGVPARLPAITCVARFESTSPARDADRDSSDLIVIWLQDDFSTSASDATFNDLSAIDWEKHARDLDFF